MSDHGSLALVRPLPEPLATLQQIGCLVIRPEDGIPGFAETDPDGKILAIALGHAGRHLRPILDALAAQSADGLEDRLRELTRHEPEMFAALRDVLVCSYLSTPAMWRLLGYGGRVPRPAAAGEAEGYLADGILDPVVARGPIYQLPEQDQDGSAVTAERRSPDGEELPDAT